MLNLDSNSYRLNEQYRQQRMDEAAHHRLAQSVKQKQPTQTIWKMWIVILGTMLVKLGTLLQVRAIQQKPQNTISRPIS